MSDATMLEQMECPWCGQPKAPQCECDRQERRRVLRECQNQGHDWKAGVCQRCGEEDMPF